MDELEKELPLEEPQLPEEIQQPAEILTEDIPVEESPIEETPVGEVSQDAPAEIPQPEPVFVPQSTPAESKRARPKKAGKVFRSIFAIIFVIALVVCSCFATAKVLNEHWQEELAQRDVAFLAEIQNLQLTIENLPTGNGGYGVSTPEGPKTPGQVYAENVDAVVAITCEVTIQDFFGYSSGYSSGSGFIVSADGYVLTNAHVVEDATAIEVMTHNEEVYTAALIGADTISDVALLKIEDEDLPYVTLGSSANLAVGDQVAAIGNPLGTLASTMTVGYVSAKDRVVATDGSQLNMIQTDAAINSGNSGGPLFNMNGEVIGITTAKYSGTSSSGATIEGIGFAIPVDEIRDILDELKGQGFVSSAYLGVSVRDVTEEAQYYGLPFGAVVQEVTPGYAAEKAGLQLHDIITALGDRKVTSVSELTYALRKFKPGDTTTITVFRMGTEVVLDITLDEKPQG